MWNGSSWLAKKQHWYSSSLKKKSQLELILSRPGKWMCPNHENPIMINQFCSSGQSVFVFHMRGGARGTRSGDQLSYKLTLTSCNLEQHGLFQFAAPTPFELNLQCWMLRRIHETTSRIGTAFSNASMRFSPQLSNHRGRTWDENYCWTSWV